MKGQMSTIKPQVKLHLMGYVHYGSQIKKRCASEDVIDMHNKYIVTILHAAIHIVMDETDRKLSMRPQYAARKRI